MPISDTGFWVDVDLEHEHAFDPSLAATLTAVLREHGVRSMYDFGCGLGQYVKTFRAAGVDAHGFDGNPLTSTFESCSVADLTDPSFVRPPVDGVLCLEVGEHVPAEYESALLQTLDRHVRPGGLLLLSWAIPGQGGLGHVNCKTNEAVCEQIVRLGYTPREDLAQRLRADSTLGWFKNTLLAFTKFPLVHTDMSGGLGNQLFQVAGCLARGLQPCMCSQTHRRGSLSPLFESFPRACSGGRFVPAYEVQRYAEIAPGLPHLHRLLKVDTDEGEDVAFLHIRGGDYVGHSLHHVALDSYYLAAVKRFSPDTHFIVLTNDTAYAERHSVLSSISYEIRDCDETAAFQTMRTCRRGGICSNSSFSWWAAALNSGRTLVLPSRWTNSTEWNTQRSDYRIPGCIVEEVGIDAYCIHLPHRVDRLAHIAALQSIAPWLQVHFVDAVHVPEAGWKGCLQSHQAVVRYAKDNRLPYILVLEDDCDLLVSPSEFKTALVAAVDYLTTTPSAQIVSGCGNLVTKTADVVGSRGGVRFLTAPDVRTTHCILYSAAAYDAVLSFDPDIPIDVQQNTCSLVFTYPYLATQLPGHSDIQAASVAYTNIEASRAFVQNLLEPPRARQEVQQPVNLRPVFRIPIRTKRV